VIEAATENSKIKIAIFSEMDQYTHPSCILATNTSSISITQLAEATQKPANVIGMHFMNPVPVMKLVEIINGKATSSEVTDTIVSLTTTIGKIPCVVKDAPGFIANRILMPMINEAILAFEEGISDAATIDQIMKLGMAHPMGPLQLADYIGLDVCKNILEIMEEGFQNNKYKPAALLTKMVEAGKLGIKTGEGFYTYQK
jgi:3-hydroxybutyryl-CoA dehydrogenase